MTRSHHALCCPIHGHPPDSRCVGCEDSLLVLGVQEAGGIWAPLEGEDSREARLWRGRVEKARSLAVSKRGLLVTPVTALRGSQAA